MTRRHHYEMIFTLREAKPSDAQRLFEVSCDEDVMEYYGTEAYTSIEQAYHELDWFHELSATKTGFRWVIADEHDMYIGNIGVFGFDPKNNRVEMGYQLDKSYWGKGIMTDAIQTVLYHCFNQYYYNRVQAVIDPLNIGSRRVLEKNGFVREGLLRDYEFERGHYVDIEMYAILAKDYIM